MVARSLPATLFNAQTGKDALFDSGRPLKRPRPPGVPCSAAQGSGLPLRRADEPADLFGGEPGLNLFLARFGHD